jgi:Domain of unknown function (DUF4845)
MNRITTQMPARQRGALYATVILLVLVGSVITAALKIIPAYSNDKIVQSAMEAITERADYTTMSISEIRSEVSRSLQVNRVENFNTENVNLTREAGKEYIDIVYETRVPMVANISAVVAFSKRYDKF